MRALRSCMLATISSRVRPSWAISAVDSGVRNDADDLAAGFESRIGQHAH